VTCALSSPYTRYPYSLHPTPYTLHPTPCSLHPTSNTLIPAGALEGDRYVSVILKTNTTEPILSLYVRQIPSDEMEYDPEQVRGLGFYG
jgi:hypothetical protein